MFNVIDVNPNQNCDIVFYFRLLYQIYIFLFTILLKL
jgi:hypothetical protein